MQNPRLLRLAVIAAAGALLIAQAVATYLLVERAREAQVAAAEATVERVSRAIEAAINRAFVQVDAMLAGLPAVLAPFARDGRLDVPSVNRVLRELNNQNFTYRDVLLLGPDGMPVASALTVSRRRRLPLPLNSSFSEAATGVALAGPVRSPGTGEWTLFFARDITLPGLGPVRAVAEVPVPVVQSLLAVSGESTGLRTTLERDDGTLLAAVPHDETRIGQRLPITAPALAGQGPHEVPGRFSSGLVYAAARPTLYPAFFVTATLQADAALAGWYRDRSRALVVSSVLSLLIVLVAAALVLALRQRERVEAERAQARQTLENALESMSDGFVMFDPADRLIACNSRYKDFYRVSAPFIVPGASFEDIMREGARRGQYPQVGDDIEGFVAESKAFHRGNHPPMERLLSDGRWVLITERRTPDGGTVGIRTDITALKRAMEDLAAARDAAAAAGEAKGQFLARMSHELRTPLNGVLGFAQVLLQDPRLTAEQREQVNTLHEAGRHLLELVNGLLDLSKIEAGRLDMHPRPTALAELLDGCARLLRPEIERKAMTFQLALAPDLPAVIEADPTRLRQLLLNLLSNAVKFTPPGGRVELSALRTAPGLLRFEVRDTGPGVPADQQHLLFEDFVQLGPSAAHDVAGTGLGLAISARLVALMGGRIGYDSPPGKGALFWIELPLRETSRAAEPPPLGAAGEADTVRPLRVLVVDDVAANRDVASAMLRAAGHQPETAPDGPTALAMLERARYDLVLMDMQMPGMDGLETTRRIRAMPPPASRMPVIALTASVLPDQVQAAREAGMNGHLPKPLERPALLRVLQTLRGADAAEAPAPAEPPLLDPAAIEILERELGHAAHGILMEFVAEYQNALALLTEAAAAERADAEHVRQAAHRLLGTARTLGARRLVVQAERLQRAAASGDPGLALQQAVMQIATASLPLIEQRVRGPERRPAEPAVAPG